jgi:hypothetical protein
MLENVPCKYSTFCCEEEVERKTECSLPFHHHVFGYAPLRPQGLVFTSPEVVQHQSLIMI